MTQKTNLNISPYYDDFDKDDQFYKVLFKPGFPVQARELSNFTINLYRIKLNHLELICSKMVQWLYLVI